MAGSGSTGLGGMILCARRISFLVGFVLVSYVEGAFGIENGPEWLQIVQEGARRDVGATDVTGL